MGVPQLGPSDSQVSESCTLSCSSGEEQTINLPIDVNRSSSSVLAFGLRLKSAGLAETEVYMTSQDLKPTDWPRLKST
ncbi:hypothetical protein GW17_00018103 [Ensete ventricosum]|nr:hypothetical protein GW17_00018103 [Ensete ventricosum]